jgi:hypothetical protein
MAGTTQVKEHFMSASLPRKALISISSYYGVIYPDGTRTGLFFTEALHPFEVLTQAGFDVDLATETGTYGLDDLSLTDRFLAGDDKAVFEDPKHPFNVKLNSQLKKAADLKAEYLRSRLARGYWGGRVAVPDRSGITPDGVGAFRRSRCHRLTPWEPACFGFAQPLLSTLAPRGHPESR